MKQFSRDQLPFGLLKVLTEQVKSLILARKLLGVLCRDFLLETDRPVSKGFQIKTEKGRVAWANRPQNSNQGSNTSRSASGKQATSEDCWVFSSKNSKPLVVQTVMLVSSADETKLN